MDERGDTFVWRHAGHDLSIGVTRRGQGPTLLMVPAPSSISTRGEMRGLQERLSGRFTTVAIDLPGFGTASKPALAWTPESQRLFVREVGRAFAPAATVAAGHSAVHALAIAAAEPGVLGRLVMVAPTWRGPLPTMLKRRPAWLGRLAALADVPLLGQALYRLNVNGPMIGAMSRAHVYADRAWLAGDRLREKRAVTGAPGARHAAVRFVAGLLDPAQDRESVLADARRLASPALLVIGTGTPPKSLAEMKALAEVATIRAVEVAPGRLAVHEESPDAVAAAISAFLE